MNLKRKHGNDEGFTLIELMVVVLVIAILLAIAIPTFLGARKRSQDAVAKTSLRNGLSAANVMFTDAQSFALANESATTGLPTVEGSLTYVISTSASTGPKILSVSAAATTWGATTLSDGGTCFTIAINSTTGATTYTKFTPTSGYTCQATYAGLTTLTGGTGTAPTVTASW
jgi:type IV pilus assembly protein PilA